MFWKGKKVLVTGGTSFIGAPLTRKLAALGASVRVVDNLSSGKREYIDPLITSGEVEFTIGSETQILRPGDCALIPGETPHGCRALSACRLLDVFTPTRDDYR